jgi:hypothetical protein
MNLLPQSAPATDNERYLVLCKTHNLAIPLTLSRLEGFPHREAMLRKIVRRQPVAFQPHAHVPDYLLCFVNEHLECGHKVVAYPQADPLIAKRRDCRKCDGVLARRPQAVGSAGESSLGRELPGNSLPSPRKKVA